VVRIAVFATILYGSAVLIPQLAQQHLGYTATLAGLVLSPGAVAIILMIPIVSLVSPYVQTRYVLGLGFFLMGSVVLLAQLAPDIDFTHLVLLRGAQHPARIPVRAGERARLSIGAAKLQGDAAALFTMFRNVAGSVGISLSTALITSRTQTHMAYLSTHSEPVRRQFRNTLQQLTNAIRNVGHGRPAMLRKRRMGQMYQNLIAQAGTPGLHGCIPLLRGDGIRVRAVHFSVFAGEESRRRGSPLMRGLKVCRDAAGAVALAACKVGPNFKQPNVEVPDNLREPQPRQPARRCPRLQPTPRTARSGGDSFTIRSSIVWRTESPRETST
jgi:hypothetical protein